MIFLKKHNIIKLIFIIILILSSCTPSKLKETATGVMSEIVICASKAVYGEMEPILLDVLYDEVFLPVRESVFKILYVPYEKLPLFKKSKNILFITNIERKDPYSKIINNFLNDENLQEVKDNRAMMFQIYDGFAKGQSILIIAGTDEEALKKMIEINRNNIVDFFKKSASRALERMVYFTGQNSELEKSIKKQFDINIKIPSDYKKSFFNKELKTFSVISHYPERIVTISVLEKTTFTYKTILEWRKKISNKYWDGDTVDTQFVKLTIDTIDFKGRNAIKILGVWGNEKENFGGPFLSYLIDNGIHYIFADGHIYNPGKRKYFKLMETNSVIHSLILDSL